MTVHLVGAGPGDPGLLTVRGAELLARAEVVVHDRLSASRLLELAPTAEIISVGKEPGGESTAQEEINRLLVERGRRGQRVVRLKGGDPFVLARGGEEAAALAAAGVDFEVVPGVSSALAAPASAGVPLTMRGLATSFTVVTGHEDPWAATETDWEALSRLGRSGSTIVILMGVATRATIAERLLAGGLAPDTPVVAVRWATRPQQHTVRTRLDQLATTALEPPSVLVVGPVAALDLAWFERRPLFGRRVVVTRAPEQARVLSERLWDLGADVIEAPVLAITEPADGGAALRAAAAAMADYAWVVFASANAVDRFLPLLRDARALRSTLVAAIGPATEAALARFGVKADLLPEEAPTAEWMVASFPPGRGRVLLPRSSIGRDVLAHGLARKGWDVAAVDAYRTVVVEVDPAVADGADAITFASPSAVRAWPDPARVPPVVACIGPVTADAAVAAGMAVSVVAPDHTAEGLADALAAHLGPGRSGPPPTYAGPP